LSPKFTLLLRISTVNDRSFYQFYTPPQGLFAQNEYLFPECVFHMYNTSFWPLARLVANASTPPAYLSL
jgi:hypothetical protein